MYSSQVTTELQICLTSNPIAEPRVAQSEALFIDCADVAQSAEGFRVGNPIEHIFLEDSCRVG